MRTVVVILAAVAFVAVPAAAADGLGAPSAVAGALGVAPLGRRGVRFGEGESAREGWLGWHVTTDLGCGANGTSGRHPTEELFCHLSDGACSSSLADWISPAHVGERVPSGQEAAAAALGALAPSPAPRHPQHTPYLFPLSARDLIGFALAAFALTLAAGGGIGGGGLLVPLYLVVFGFDARSAVALSNATILGGTLTNLVINVARRHPLRDDMLIDWDLILVMEPCTMLGAVLGGIANRILPGWLTASLLTALLSFITHNLAGKALVVRRKELAALAVLETAEGDDADADYDEDVAEIAREREAEARRIGAKGAGARLLTSAASGDENALLDASLAITGRGGAGRGRTIREAGTSEEEDAPPEGGDGAEGGDGVADPLLGPRRRAHPLPRPASLSKWLSEYKAEAPPRKIALLLVLLLIVVAFDVLKGRVSCGGVSYWLASFGLVPVVLIVLLIVREHLLLKHKRRAERGFDYQEGDVVWNSHTTLLYPILCTFAGVCAGTFGIGGGIVKGPLMLEMGVLPDVAAATSATMIFFTAASACVVFVSMGTLPFQYGAVVFTLGIIFTAVGQGATSYIAERLKSRAVIVWTMVAIMALSTVVLFAQSVVYIDQAWNADDLWRFGRICGAAAAA